jgi:hypothetical protein
LNGDESCVPLEKTGSPTVTNGPSLNNISCCAGLRSASVTAPTARRACTSCRFLRVDPAQLGRLNEMTENAEQRLLEAQDKGWLGEVAALEESLKHLRTRQAEAQRRLDQGTNPIATETAQ